MARASSQSNTQPLELVSGRETMPLSGEDTAFFLLQRKQSLSSALFSFFLWFFCALENIPQATEELFSAAAGLWCSSSSSSEGIWCFHFSAKSYRVLVISRKPLSENENTGPAMCQNTPITMDKKRPFFFFRIYPILHSVSIETHSLTDPGFVPLKEAAIKVPSHLCACASVCVSSGVNVESAVFPMKIFILERVANIQD